MPPRPRPIPRKPSNASKDVSEIKVPKAEHDSRAMPPPPVPAPSMGILEPEMIALKGCLQSATVKMAQMLAFHSDARRLQIQRHASAPPQALQASLGHELEKYDQLCDAMEIHLIRAISVLQRDLQREQQRVRDEEKAAAAAALAAAEAEAAAKAESMALSPKSAPSGSTEPSMQNSNAATPVASANQSPVASNAPGGRRPSAISISSLNRPNFPLKLDLSASSLRMSAEDASSFMSSGLHSPVTLAPKSARPMDYDLMAALAAAETESQVDIDLTLPTDGPSTNSMNLELNSNVGNTADKPIELDMEGMDIDQAMSDLFGDPSDQGNNDTNSVVDDLFSPVLGGPGDEGSSSKDEANFLSSLGVDMKVPIDGGDSNNDIFASFNVGSVDGSSARPDRLNSSATDTVTAPSPGAILASFSNNSNAHPDPAQSLPSDESFDLGDLDFFSTENNTDISLWPMPDANGGSGGGVEVGDLPDALS